MTGLVCDMPTIPTGRLERELRALYLRWIRGLSVDTADMATRINQFQAASEALIAREGGRVAALGALGDFPAPRLLELSPTVGVVYSQMQQAAVQASILTGISSKDAARQMFQAGMDKSYRRLERFARTETTNAYWKNAFDSITDLPALVMLWGSEDGPRTCPWCRERDGLVIDGYDVRDHPNGRCTPIPTLRSRVEYRGSVRRDGTIFWDKDWNKVAKPTPAIDYEEKFVKSFTDNLESGTWSRAQLRAMASQENVSALGKANANEALRRYQESVARRPLSHAKVDLPSLSSDQLSALQPSAKFTEAVRNKLKRTLDETPMGESVKETLMKFQNSSRRSIVNLRNDVEKYVKGEELAAGRVSTIENLLGAMRSSPVPDNVTIQRGMMMPGDFKSTMARYEAGDPLDLSISSFSSNRIKAEEFSRITEGQRVTGQTTQMLVTVRGPSHAIPIENLSPGGAGSVLRKEREWVASGRYKVAEVVEDVDSYGNPMVHVYIEEVEPW